MKKKKKDTTYDYYKKNTFWNDHFLVKEYINQQITDNPKTDWMKFFFDKYFAGQEGKVKALSVGCGNGWQDRDLDTHFKFKKLDGFDISESLIGDAVKKAPSKNFSYGLRDLNNDSLPHENYYDLAINVAALHHVENMEHIVSQVHKTLKPGGLFVHFEYIGPKRDVYKRQPILQILEKLSVSKKQFKQQMEMFLSFLMQIMNLIHKIFWFCTKHF